MIRIEAEREEHGAAVERLLDDAFVGNAWRRRTCHRIREGRMPARGLSLVAMDGDRLVGTVRNWDVAIGRAADALMLGPLAVAGNARAAGIGAALVRETMALAAAQGRKRMFLVGDPEFYGRFAFHSANAAGIVLPGPVEKRRLLGAELAPTAFAGVRGMARAA